MVRSLKKSPLGDKYHKNRDKNRTHKVSSYRNSPLGNKQLDYVNIEGRVKLSKAWAPYSYANHECVFKFIGYEYKSSPARSRNYKTEVQ